MPRERDCRSPHGSQAGTAEGDPELLLRIRDEYDGAEPAGNSIAILNRAALPV